MICTQQPNLLPSRCMQSSCRASAGFAGFKNSDIYSNDLNVKRCQRNSRANSQLKPYASGASHFTPGFGHITVYHSHRRASPKNKVTTALAAAAAPIAPAAAGGLAGVLFAAQTPLWLLGLQCAGSAAAAICGAMVLSRVCAEAAEKAEAGEELEWMASMDGDDSEAALKDAAHDRGFVRNILDAFIVALHRPAALFVPIAALIFSLKTSEGYMRAILIHQLAHGNLHQAAEMALNHGASALSVVDKIVTEIDEVILIAAGVWILLRFKERLVAMAMRRSAAQQAGAAELAGAAMRAQQKEYALQRVVLPVSGIASWLLVLAGVLMVLHVVGINIAPLLTVGGVSGVIVGLSAQSVMANMISGINLLTVIDSGGGNAASVPVAVLQFISQPFLVGDRVEIATASGSTVLTGVVERIDPMRTIVRSDNEVPITIPNKILAEMIIYNESRVGGSRVQAAYSKPRALSFTLALRYEDLTKMGRIIKDMQSYLANQKYLEHSLKNWVGLKSITDYSANVYVIVHTNMQGSREFGSVRQRLLLGLHTIVQENGAKLAYPVQMMVDSDEVKSISSAGHTYQDGLSSIEVPWHPAGATS